MNNSVPTPQLANIKPDDSLVIGFSYRSNTLKTDFSEKKPPAKQLFASPEIMPNSYFNLSMTIFAMFAGVSIE